jgi:site-specific DNA recombinase
MEGHSIAAQRQRLVEYCARKGLKVIKTFELVESSTRGERREFAAMLEFAQAHKETVAIVADAVDRFQRSFKESVLIDELIRKEQAKPDQKSSTIKSPPRRRKNVSHRNVKRSKPRT